MRIESSLSSTSVEDRVDSPQSSLSLLPSPPPSPTSRRGSESTSDNTPIARWPFLRRDGGSSFRRNIWTTPEQSSGRVPQLVDEEIVNLEDDGEDAADAPVEDVPPAGLPSVLTRVMLDGIARTCRFLRQLQMRAPTADERPWTPPPGWMCLYEAFFTHSRLWFSLPRLLTSYAAARDIALTQFTPAAMRNVVAALVLGAEVGIDVDLRFFEELATISRNPGTPNTFYINIKSRHGILRGRVNKAHEWFQHYFFIRIDSASMADLNAVLRGTWNSSPKRHPISLPPPAGFPRGVENIRELGVQQWFDFDRDHIFRSVSRISAAVWGAPSGDRSGHRDRSSLRPSSPVPPRRAARSPSVRTRGVRRDIPPYSSVMNDEVTGPSLREGNRGMAQSNPLNCDVEPERAFCESDGMTPAAPEGGEPVSVERGASDTALTGGFMADATRSVVREGRESRSLKRPCECVPTEGAPEEKISRRDPYARVFRYNKGTPFVNDERACAEYFYLLRNAFTDIPDVDDLVHAQEFKDMSRSTAQSNAHAVRLMSLYKRELRRVRAKLEDMFAEKESCDARIKELDVTVYGLSSSAEVLRAELAASSGREAILRYLERSHEDYAAKEVARAVREAVAKYWGRLERVRAYLDDQERVKEVVFKENQMTGIVSCHEVCIEEGIPIPSEKLRRHRVALRENTDLLDNTEVATLENDDLVLSPLPSSS
ncbi:PREDICTED: uncharacterized protein LOC106344875 [Brassica oleracea var. oleracea]|uniref:uncharacterized protein LOC106344875 n=1 Tax=Brassica oleracea var. oleracea TaxID=109376 RepID=UPI0006A7160B|nr:PREDICTED: uncharacterized protein LOC106344875 [Brassica oleracea var. oleracea]